MIVLKRSENKDIGDFSANQATCLFFVFYTGWSKSLYVPDDYNTEVSS